MAQNSLTASVSGLARRDRRVAGGLAVGVMAAAGGLAATSGTHPLASSLTALLILVQAGLLAAAMAWPGVAGVRGAAVAGGWLTGFVALLVGWGGFVAFLVGTRTSPPPVAPGSALGLLLLATALAVAGGGRSQDRWRCLIALGLALMTLVLAGVATLAHSIDLPLSVHAAVPLASLGSACLLAALAFAMAVACDLRRALVRVVLGEPLTAETEDAVTMDRGRRWALFAFALAIGLIGTAAHAYLRFHRDQVRGEVEATLVSVLDLKLAQVNAWRRERREDAQVLARLPQVREALAAAEGRDRAAALARLEGYLGDFADAYGYAAVRIADPSGRVLGEAVRAAAPPVEGSVAESELDEARLLDFATGDDGRVYLGVRAPVRDAPAGAVKGLVVLQIDTAGYLFPLLAKWPVPQERAEVYLLRTEGAELRLLNPAERSSGEPLGATRPRAQSELAAVRAQDAAPDQLVEGIDLAGQEVLGVGRPVTGTRWQLFATLNRADAYAPFWSEIRLVLYGLLTLAALLGLGVRYLWRQRQARLLAEKLEAERERHEVTERLSLVLRHANDAIVLFDGAGRIVDANDRVAVLYGYAPEEMRRLEVRDLRAPVEQDRMMDQFRQAQREHGLVFETEHRRRDGSTFPVEVSARPVEYGGRPHVLSIVRDITERKNHQREIERLSRMYQVVSLVNQAIVHGRSPEELSREICRVLVEVGAFRIAWIGWLDAANGWIVPAAVAGDSAGYVEGLRISVDPQRPEGLGPSGQAFRENQNYVCNDFFAEPTTGPWRERARISGFHSSMSLPIRRQRKPVGLLAVYASERDFFGPKEIALLDEAAGDLSYALEVFARDERRRQAELALQENEARLQTLLTATPAIIYSLRDHDYTTTFISGNVERVLGYRPEEFIGNPTFWRDRVHPEDLAAALGATGRLATGGAIVREYRFLHRGGQYRWMHDELRVIPATGGRAAELIGYWIDVTARREAEQQLYTLSSAVEQSPVSVVITDLDGSIEYVNRHFTELTGYSLDDVRGLNPRVFKSGQTPREVFTELWATLKRGEVWRGEIVNRKKNGDLHTEAVVIAPARGASGRPTHYVALKEDITARRQADAALRQMSRIIEQAPLSVAITDLDGALEYVNPKFCEVSGYAAEEVIGQNPRVLKSGRTPPAVYQDMWRSLKEGRVWRGELQNRKKNGDLYVEMAVLAPVVDGAGRTTHYVALKEDITAQKRTAQALEEAQARYALIAENTADVIWLYELDAEAFSYVSPSIRRVLGYAPEELLGRPLTTGLDEASAAMVRRELPERLAALATDSSARTRVDEVRQLRRDGTAVPFEVATTILTDETGHPIRLLGVSREITAQLEAREALRRFNAELEHQVAQRTAELASRTREVQGLLQAVPDLIMQLRADGTLVHLQPAHGAGILARLAGGGRGSLPPLPPHPELLRASLEAGRQALAGGDAAATEVTITIPAGEIVVELRAAPVGPDEFVIIGRDITTRKRLETETAAMLEKERQISEMKSRFISVTSHEFRTPMAAALGSVEILANHLDRLPAPKRQELLDRIGLSLRRMTEMLDDVLSLSRIDARRLNVRLAPVDLGALVRLVADEARLADRDAHRIEVETTGETGPATTDPGLVHHILSNLLSNALRYSEAGTVVRVRLHLDSATANFSVVDQGIGIPPGEETRIFEAFERGSNVGTIKGTGLGLNIVKRMTELLGGEVRGANLPDGGACFTVTLPRHLSATP